MVWYERIVIAGVVGVGTWALSGCASSLPDWALPPESPSKDLFKQPSPRLVRPQSPDSPAGVVLKKPIGTFSDTGAPLGAPPGIALPPGLTPPVDFNPPVVQTNLTIKGTVRVSVRAWVNNRPIFDDEVMQVAGPEFRRLGGLTDSQRDEQMAKVINAALDQIIEQELLYQDAVRKLEKNNPRGLEKLREAVDQEFEKSLERMRKAEVPEKQIRELEPTARRMLERSLIATEYARTRIMPQVQNLIGLREVRDYYESHKNEFVTVNRIEWQDIFIPVSPERPTVQDVKAFAEELVNRCRTVEDFNRMMVYNEGDSKLRGGAGLGQREGEIGPSELEPVLFGLREGEIGPVVPFATGVHIVRIAKREYKRLLPLDEKTQKLVRKKLEGQLMEREYRRIVRELRDRAVVRIERST
ncbi:MAG: peptidyl-prolyl cis-trans isomerase [Gemmataceae bacterium]|nr:peptidyl-prolyl cis-trans isomerase [Gemmataceae bacterium]